MSKLYKKVDFDSTTIPIPRMKIPTGPRSDHAPSFSEQKAFYARYRELTEGTDILPESWKGAQGKIAYLLRQCKTWEIDAIAYLEWAFEAVQSGKGIPEYLFGWMKSEKCMRRFWVESKRAPIAAPAKKNTWIDERTGEPVRWAYNKRGNLLLTIPEGSEVYDNSGNPIPLRRL